ncbi:hypothetical protein PYW08_008338 [Mythimna loreyi]|uniref:Uncharacterized protein n=1 Tax=Mythimna loreyi TaxID=667449 RepID=A0ACC2QG41_9NEOP|nr:hypothetical protein PYW08_008338 [Mythimna loreyi]
MIVLCTIRRIIHQHCRELKNVCWAIKVVRSQSTVNLSHKIHGPNPTPNGEAIVVLHGLLGSKRNWQSMCGKITAHTNKSVIVVDARNHGDSPHSDDHDYFSLAADVSQLISKLSIKKSTVIGHSMGGRTGMVLALTEPSKVARLIVVDISPIIPTSGGRLLDFFPKLINVMISVDFNGMDTLEKAMNAAKTKIAESQLFSSEDSMYFILMNVGKLPDNSFGWKCNVKALKNNFVHIASFPNMGGKTYDGPTLFIGGKLSDFIPPGDITGIQKLFPKANLVYIEGVGHNVHAEDPTAFFNVVAKFLS